MCLDLFCLKPSRRLALAAAAGAAVSAIVGRGNAAPLPRGMNFNFTREGDTIFGYRVAPIGRRARATAVVLHGNADIPDDVKATADWLASLGFVALAVNSTSREPDPTKIPRSVLMGRGYGDRYIADTRAGLASLGPTAPKGPIAVVGYCGGGYTGLLWGAEQLKQEIGALVAIHTPLHNRDPDGTILTGRPQGIDLYRSMEAPTQWHFGGSDGYTPAKDIAELRALKKGRQHAAQIHIYAGGQHGFAMSTHDTYIPKAAELIRMRAERFLAAHF